MKRKLSIEQNKEIKALLQSFNVKQVSKKTGLGPVLIRNIRDEMRRDIKRRLW
jgi:hypothetical protein